MNKKTVLLVGFGILILLLVTGMVARRGVVPEPPAQPVRLEKPEVILTLDFGKGDIATVSTTAKTAYDALKNVTDVKGIPVKTKQYDFGIFVESIRDISSGRDKAWIYFVNGKSAQVAADKYELVKDDRVEWRYTEVKNE